MNEPRRLFDCLEMNLEKNPLPVMMAAKENGEWKSYSTTEIVHQVDLLSAGLLQLGISCGDMSEEGRDKVGILCKNRPEWMIIDLAVQRIGAVLTPLYPTIGVNDLEFVLNDAKVKIVFVNDEELYKKLLSVKDQVPSLEEIYTIEKVEGARNWTEITSHIRSETLSLLPGIRNRIGYHDLATIIYTSGTTGTPKGVMLSHENILSNVIACMPCFPPQKERCLSFLPLNHIFERMVTYLYLYAGVSIYYAESLETIGDNLKEVKPQIFTTVPRLLEKVYDKIMQKGAALTGMKRKLFFWAHGLAEKYDNKKSFGPGYKLQLALANKLIFSKWREALGNEIRCIVSGGAACQVRLIRIFTAAKIPIMEGYGLTETSPVIAVNRYQEHQRKFGTVGPLIQDVEVKIADDGEIFSKGPHIMMGYYKRPDLTSEVMIDGWFATGDIGVLVDEDGNNHNYSKGVQDHSKRDNIYLKITDRKKEMFKTSGGKYVAPLPIENKLKESPFIEQVMVIGSDRKFVSALIVPSFPNLRDWCNHNGVPVTEPAELIKNEKVMAMYKDLLDNFNTYFNHVEQVKKFELLPNEWGIDTGEMTPKLSLRRKVVMEKYADVIERIYNV